MAVQHLLRLARQEDDVAVGAGVGNGDPRGIAASLAAIACIESKREHGQRAARLFGAAAAAVEVLERGPLLGSVRVTAQAPGARGLVQEISLRAGAACLDIVNTIDKQRVLEKEGVHFAFPFHVPGGAWRLEGG